MEKSQIEVFKKLIFETVSNSCSGSDTVGVALSSGIDSNLLMFSLLEAGKKVRAYSFHREGVLSTDYVLAKQNAETLNVPFTEVVVPNELDMTKLKKLMTKYNLKSKTDIECTYTMSFVWEAMGRDRVPYAVAGIGIDNHFGSSKTASIHYKETLELNQEYRKIKYDRYDFETTGRWGLSDQAMAWVGLANENGVSLKLPATEKQVYDFFYTKTWYELNEPTQKHPMWECYPEYVKKLDLRKHTNLQCGDSLIRELFEPMLESKLNKKSRKRIMDLYRDLHEEYNSKKSSLSKFIVE